MLGGSGEILLTVPQAITQGIIEDVVVHLLTGDTVTILDNTVPVVLLRGEWVSFTHTSSKTKLEVRNAHETQIQPLLQFDL